MQSIKIKTDAFVTWVVLPLCIALGIIFIIWCMYTGAEADRFNSCFAKGGHIVDNVCMPVQGAISFR